MRACRLVAGKQRRFKHSSELQRAVAKVAVTLVPALACSAALGDPILPLTPTVTGSTYNIAAQYSNGSYVYGGPISGDWANDINNTAIACNSAGGGTVLIPTGTFQSAPFSINAGNLNLDVEGTLQSIAQSSTTSYFIYFTNGKGSEITGSGTIDGNYSAWSGGAGGSPQLIHLSNPQTFLIQGVTLLNSVRENVVFAGTKSSNVTLNHVTIIDDSGRGNTDGVDPNGNNILIENCNISTGDDDVAIKAPTGTSGTANGCNNLTIVNCTFGYGHGVSFGGQTNYGITSVLVNNCTFTNTGYGIRFKANRSAGGIVQNIAFTNLTMTGVMNAVYYTSWYNGSSNSPPLSPYLAGNQSSNTYKPGFTSVWQNVTISNLTSTGAPSSSNGVYIYGLPESPMQGITFTNDSISASNPALINFAGDYVSDPDTFNASSSPFNISSPNIYFDGTDALNGVTLDSPSLLNNSSLFTQPANKGLYDANVIIAVPEPASATMLLLAPALMLRRRKRSSG